MTAPIAPRTATQIILLNWASFTKIVKAGMVVKADVKNNPATKAVSALPSGKLESKTPTALVCQIITETMMLTSSQKRSVRRCFFNSGFNLFNYFFEY